MSTTSSSPRRLLALVDLYQRAVEGRPSPCRFTPSCSSYAKDALEVHGARRGTWLTVLRLLRCRPFGPSGFDPVPEPVTATPSSTPTSGVGSSIDPSSAVSSSVVSRSGDADPDVLLADRIGGSSLRSGVESLRPSPPHEVC